MGNSTPSFLRMELFSAALRGLLPRFSPLFLLISFVAVLSTLLSGFYPTTRPPLPISTNTITNNSPVVPIHVENIRLVTEPNKNRTSTIEDANMLKNFTSSSHPKVVDSRKRCDLFVGRWLVDPSRPIYKPGSCPYIDSAFDCYRNGRTDLNYTRLRWQPKECSIPRFNGRRMLEILRGRRLVFVGDSLNRNMWQSLVCMLWSFARIKKNVYEISGRREFKTQGSYSIKFDDYNCTVEFFRSPFLVQEWKSSYSKGMTRETLRLDMVHNSSTRIKDADIIVFNSAHWWTHEKTSRGKDFYQEGNHVHNQLSALKAYRKALITWARWVDRTIDCNRTRVFFRGSSTSHFRWETLPITEGAETLPKYPKMMGIFESVMEDWRVHVHYMNITRMTDYRKDGHPSIFRFPPMLRKPGDRQDCSHWCLPGVPDAWNEILYVMLLRRDDNYSYNMLPCMHN